MIVCFYLFVFAGIIRIYSATINSPYDSVYYKINHKDVQLTIQAIDTSLKRELQGYFSVEILLDTIRVNDGIRLFVKQIYPNRLFIRDSNKMLFHQFIRDEKEMIAVSNTIRYYIMQLSSAVISHMEFTLGNNIWDSCQNHKLLYDIPFTITKYKREYVNTSDDELEYEEMEKLNISEDYSLDYEPKIDPYSNRKYIICTFSSEMQGKPDLICLYNADSNTVKIIDSIITKKVAKRIYDKYGRLYFGIDNDTLYFYDCKTRQYYYSEYPFDKASKYNGSRIPIFNHIRKLKLIEHRVEYIIHNNQDLIYINDTSHRLCHYSFLYDTTIVLRKQSAKLEGHMFPFSSNKVLLIEGVFEGASDYQIPYIYNYETKEITEVNLQFLHRLWDVKYYDNNVNKVIIKYNDRFYEATIVEQDKQYYLVQNNRELLNLTENSMRMFSIYDIFRYENFYIFKKMDRNSEAYFKIKKWW